MVRPKGRANLSLRFPTGMELMEAEELIGSLSADRIESVPAGDAIEGMKFSECLPPHLAAEVFRAQFPDAAVGATLAEPRRGVTGA